MHGFRPPTPPHLSVFCLADHGLDEEVIDRVGRLLGIHGVVEIQLVLLKRLFDTAYHLPIFAIRSSSTCSWPLQTMLFLALSVSERVLSPESGHACRCSLPLEVGFTF